MSLVAGHFELMRDGDYVWIRDLVSGEGGRFPVADVAAAVERFFEERF